MSIIESIRTFICTFPLLKDGVINVDFLGAKPTEYTVDGIPSSNTIKKYADGGRLKQYTFYFASREYYGEDVLSNIANSSFYEDFGAWLTSQSKAGTLPVLTDGKEAQTIEALSTGYMFDGTAGNARYQIQCRLVYYENRR